MNPNEPYYADVPSSPASSARQQRWLWLGGCLIVGLFGLCLVTIGALGAYLYWPESEPSAPTVVANIEATRVAEATSRAAAMATLEPTNTAVSESTAPVPTPELIASVTPTPVLSQLTDVDIPSDINQSPIPERAAADLDALHLADYPSHDYFDTAVRLGKKELGARTVEGIPAQVGEIRTFFSSDAQIDAQLMAVTKHAQFWVDVELNLDPTEVQDVATVFEQEYYPVIISLFGNFWDPGVDNLPSYSILHIKQGSDGELGSFNSLDQFPRTLYDTSNEQELVYMSMENLAIGSDLYYGTLVHELQHLIQWYVDPSESLWLNEGLSQLAELYVGLYTATTTDYLLAPETQLNTWGTDEEVYAHYAAAYLFSVYIWEQLGETAVQELVRHPANGLSAVRAVLEGYAPDLTLSEFVGQWAVANYLDTAVAGPAFGYESLSLRTPIFVETIPADRTYAYTAVLNQFGVHYVDLTALRGPATITFAGDTVIDLIDAAPTSGQQMWFTPPMSDLNARLTRTFDLTNVEQATLRYNIWYDLERDYDFAYVLISTDGGVTWDILQPDSAGVGEFGPAYNGRSDFKTEARNGWLKESVSLNSYTGQEVKIRFELLTDTDIVNQGMAIDDISIREIGYASDVEPGSLDGWEAEGFVPVGWQLPQQWQLLLIQEGPNPTVETFSLDALNQGQWDVEIGKGGAVLVIVPTTPFVYEPAVYWLQVEP